MPKNFSNSMSKGKVVPPNSTSSGKKKIAPTNPSRSMATSKKTAPKAK